jgi:chromosome segregation protein
MKVDYVELCGFRGFRDKVRVDFGAGFTVITGRNGVGKSTLCDAMEFAVLGEIGKYGAETAAQETVKDYIWWRGEGVPEANFVTVAFSEETGKQFVVTRTREGGADKTIDELAAALCRGAMPEDPLRQLCKTAIIRDEWIAALSLDLKETERFDLVRAALGSVEGADLAGKAKAVIQAAEASFRRAEESYERARAQLSGGLVQLSEASTAASRGSDVSAAMTTLDAIAPADPGEELAKRLERARRILHDRRQRLEDLGKAAFDVRELMRLRADYESPEAVARRTALSETRARTHMALERYRSELDLASKAYEVEARGSEIAASLSALVEHGEAVGLRD